MGVLLEPGEIENRLADRRTINLELPATRTSHDGANVIIRDLSTTGFRIETSIEFQIGETFGIELPEAGLTEACIIWRDGRNFGCQLLAPISRPAISAALLRAPFEAPDASPSADLTTINVTPSSSTTSHGLDSAINWAALTEQAATVEIRHDRSRFLVPSLTMLTIAVSILLIALLALPISGMLFGQ